MVVGEVRDCSSLKPTVVCDFQRYREILTEQQVFFLCIAVALESKMDACRKPLPLHWSLSCRFILLKSLRYKASIRATYKVTHIDVLTIFVSTCTTEPDSGFQCHHSRTSMATKQPIWLTMQLACTYRKVQYPPLYVSIIPPPRLYIACDTRTSTTSPPTYACLLHVLCMSYTTDPIIGVTDDDDGGGSGIGKYIQLLLKSNTKPRSEPPIK